MKKFAPYILILVVLLGFLSPSVSHADPYSDCANALVAKGITDFSSCNGLSGTTQNGYTLLAPLPKVSPTFDPTDDSALGKYLNIMIEVVIGLSAVFAVVMIVIGGIEYMTSELISSKEAGKEKIEGALLGLIIALGAYALLNTINPDLLNSDLEISQATITVMLEGETLADAVISEGGTPPPTPTTLCPSGIQKTSSGMYACGNIATNLDKMISTARQAGLNISGGGYRTPSQQQQLRVKNCNGDVANKNASCNPPTALPGASRHNNGLAFDLKCNGTLIQNPTNACFVWLKTNAGQFGLYNLSSEPWHWSTDGR